MRINITDIYRIETMNSVYEIKVAQTEGGVQSMCKKMGRNEEKHQVQANGTEYLDKLFIGASFKVPGVVTTSIVQDYQHFTLTNEPKRSTMAGGLSAVVDAIKEQIDGGPVLIQKELTHIQGVPVRLPLDRVYKGYGPGCSEYNHVGGCTCDLPPTCKVAGCSWSGGGPSHDGSRMCKSGSIASGGTRAHCSCDYCY